MHRHRHYHRKIDAGFDLCLSRLRYIRFLGELMADEIARLNTELTDLRATVDAFRDQKAVAIDALNATVADLKAQLAAGTPGLTAEQGDAFAAQIKSIVDDLAPVPPQ